MNKVMLLGNVGRDVETKTTQAGIVFTTLSIATEKLSKGEDGKTWNKGVEWHNVEVFGKQAENCGKYVKKGQTVLVEGRLQTDKYEDKATGEQKTKLKIIATDVRFIGKNREPDAENKKTVSDQESEEIPF